MSLGQVRRVAVCGLVAAVSFLGRAGAGQLSPEQYREIEETIAGNVAELEAQGLLAPPVPTSVPLGWPLRAASGLTDSGYHGVQNFVDHNPSMPNQLRDFACGQRTTDAGNVNHRGTDFALWPFPWLKMENDEVEVVSAAAGTIVLKQNGNYDKNCSCAGTANAVYVRHADGSTAWYVHLKNNSLTTKAVGAGVAAGEYLGVVGSSGCSSGPHLHFELYNASGQLQDPYAGTCNTWNASWWANQRPYLDTAVNAIVTGTIPPELPTGCAALEQPNETTSFIAPITIYFTVYYREVAGQIATYRVWRPDGSVQEAWTYALPTHNGSHPHTVSRFFIPSVPDGTWRFTVTLAGQTVEQPFFMGVTPAGRTTSLTAGKSTYGVELTWVDDAACAMATTYGIHVGTLGDYYSQVPVGCNYAGSATLYWGQVEGSRYFLVVPQSETREGSHGLDSNGVERPQGPSSCLPRELGCP